MTNHINIATPLLTRTRLKARFLARIAVFQKTRLQRELKNQPALNGMLVGLSPDMASFDFGHYDPIDQDSDATPKTNNPKCVKGQQHAPLPYSG